MVSDSAESVLVNETFVREAGWKDPIGQIVDFFYRNKKYKVIGVVKDYHFISLAEKLTPELFTMNPQMIFRDIFIKIRPDNVPATLHAIEKSFNRTLPFQPYSYVFANERNAENYQSEAKWKQMILSGSIITIFISCIGLFGLAALSAEKRKKEIGIRKVLGASVQAIVQQLSNDFLKLVLVAALIAAPIAWWAMHQWLEHYPYRIGLSSWIFLLAVTLVLGIALGTVSYQSIRAAIANPVKSLRTE
jgi:putative ABC transport system permease protein